MSHDTAPTPRPPSRIPRVLVVDDEADLRELIEITLVSMGLDVDCAANLADAHRLLARGGYALCLTDMRLPDGEGIDLVTTIARQHPSTPVAVITAFGSAENAVAALKAGAFDYLAKPADADEIDAALRSITPDHAQLPENPMSADRVRWEHIQRVYELCGRNVSETARRLSMHRRTLQRILAKRAPR